jgi:molecular chaperone GrpE
MAKEKNAPQATAEKEEAAEAKDEAVTEAEAEERATEVETAEEAAEVSSEGPAGADETVETAEETVEAETPSLEEQLELARQEAGKNLDGWQRAVAELANFKRRQEEQLKRQRDRIKGEMLEGVISALDDMDLAFQNVPEEIDGQLVGWVEGFRLVQRKLNKVLDEQNVMLINTEGEFDPNVHEAVSYEESDEHEEGQIIGELRKGYQIGNRVLRPALVRVAK